MKNATVYELTDHCIQKLRNMPHRTERWFVVNDTGMAVEVYNHRENADALAEKSAGTLRTVLGTCYKLDKIEPVS